jgi:hypothetical protein
MKLDLHQAATKNKKNEHGLVSIITVTLIVIILALMTAGFAKIMDRELRQSLDRELATQANYAAEAGLNDARNYIANAQNPDTAGGCLDTANLDPITQAPYFANKGSISNGLGDLVKYTCINIDTNPKELSYDILAGTSRLVRVAPSSSIDKLYFSWNNSGAGSGTGSQPISNTVGSYPSENFWNAGGGHEQATGVLRSTIYPVPGDGRATDPTVDKNQLLESLQKDFFLYPNGGPGGTFGSIVAASTNGTSVGGECNTSNYTTSPIPNSQSKHFCNVQVNSLEQPIAAPVVNITANGAAGGITINDGASFTLSWNVTNAINCTASSQPANAQWGGALTAPFSGSKVITNMTAGTHFILTCQGVGGGANGYVTVNVTRPTVSMYGSQYVACQPLEAFACGTTGNPGGVYDYQLFQAVYNTNTLNTAYTLRLNYGQQFNGVLPDPPCAAGYSFLVNVYVNGVLYLNNWALPQCAGSVVANLGNLPPNAQITFRWVNNVFVSYGGYPFYDPNWRIDSFALTPNSQPAAPPSIALPAIPGALANAFYYVKLTALYKDLTVSIQGKNSAGTSVSFKKAQAVVDVTAKGNDVLKRLQSRIGIDPNYDYPSYAVQSMDTLCKKLRLPIGPLGAADYQNARYDDTTNGDSYAINACSAGGALTP